MANLILEFLIGDPPVRLELQDVDELDQPAQAVTGDEESIAFMESILYEEMAGLGRWADPLSFRDLEGDPYSWRYVAETLEERRSIGYRVVSDTYPEEPPLLPKGALT